MSVCLTAYVIYFQNTTIFNYLTLNTVLLCSDYLLCIFCVNYNNPKDFLIEFQTKHCFTGLPQISIRVYKERKMCNLFNLETQEN